MYENKRIRVYFTGNDHFLQFVVKMQKKSHQSSMRFINSSGDDWPVNFFKTRCNNKTTSTVYLQGVSKVRVLSRTEKNIAFQTVGSMKPCKLIINIYTLTTENISSLHVLLCFFMAFFMRLGIEWARSFNG